MAATRFLVRRETKEVFIYTEALRKGYPELAEVIADSVAEALDKRALPDPRSISLAEIDAMTKKELIEFAKLRLNLELDASQKLAPLQNEVKVAIFTMGRSDEDIEEVQVDMRSAKAGDAITKTTPHANAKAARGRAGA